MLRIISFFLLLIISQLSFSQVTASTETIPAISSPNTKVWFYQASPSTASADIISVCNAYGAYKMLSLTSYNLISASLSNVSRCNLTLQRKSDGYIDNFTYYEWLSYRFETVYTCPSGYTLSGTNCTKDVSIDSCTEYAGQSGYFWVSKVSPPSTICSGTCLASAVAVAGFPDADPLSWQYLQYTYSGETSGCTSDSGFTDEATAAAANAAAAERERLKKIEEAIAAAKTACGGEGHYTIGTFNGNTVVTCKDTGVQTTTTGDVTTTTVTNADGSTTTTTTTTTNNTSTTNNNSSTTINSDGSTSSSGGASGSTSGTTTSVVTRAPDGTVISSSTSGVSTTSGAVGICSSDDMAGTLACAEIGDAPEADDLSTSEASFDFSHSAFGGSDSGACPSSIVVMPGVEFSFDNVCSFFERMRPFVIGIAWLIAAYIVSGSRNTSGGDD